MTYEEMMQVVAGLEGEVLQTKRGNKFTVGQHRNCLLVTPASTGLPRNIAKSDVVKFVKTYNESRSLRPADYQNVTYNSSYYVVLAAIYEKVTAVQPR